jgi:protein-disulfide isomerase
VVAAGVVLVAVGLADRSSSPSRPEPPAASSTQAADPAASEDPGLARREEADPMALGRTDAPVTVVEYADFRCPYCARFARDTLPEIVKRYVETGLVRYEFRDLPFFGDQSVDAAVAARAAARQGRFWEYLDAVYRDAPDRGHPEMPRSTLVEFAARAGVPDRGRFAADLDDPQLRAAVIDEGRKSQALGIDGVPFFAIDNVALSGAQPMSVFTQVIEERLQAHGRSPSE